MSLRGVEHVLKPASPLPRPNDYPLTFLLPRRYAHEYWSWLCDQPAQSGRHGSYDENLQVDPLYTVKY
jgi:hypothetical protein